MNKAITRINALLSDLATQAKYLDKENQHSKAHKIIQENNLFSDNLFTTHSDLYFAYVQEVQSKVQSLQRLLSEHKAQLAHISLQQIEQQISALHTALNSNNTLHKAAEQRLVAVKSRRYKKAAQKLMHSSHSLHQKLSETFEFERRLLAMIEDREIQQKTNPSSNQQLTAEILALHQRLGRCRQAISKLEREIAQFSKD